MIGKAADLLSGPEGLAGFLRRSQLGARLAGPSLPLDIGFSKDIPAAHQARRHAPRPALPVPRRMHPASPRPAKSTTSGTWKTAARPAPARLHTALRVPSPGGDSPVGLDAGAEPGRHHHRVEQGQDQDPAQPQPTRPPRVTPRVSGATGFTSKLGLVAMGKDPPRLDHRSERSFHRTGSVSLEAADAEESASGCLSSSTRVHKQPGSLSTTRLTSESGAAQAGRTRRWA